MTTGIAASASQVAWYYTPETAGVISNTAPAWTPIRFTQNTLSESASELASGEMRPDRHVVDTRRGSVAVKGDITGELTFGTYDALISAGFASAFTANTISTGVTRSSFSILKRNLDIGVDTLYSGCQVDSIKISCPLQGIVTVVFGMVGKAGAAYVVPVGSTWVAESTTDFMTTFDGSLTIGGAAFGSATTFDLILTNNLVAKYALFSNTAYDMSIGMIGVTGTLAAYIEDDSLKGDWRSDSNEALSIVLTDAATGGNKYTITIPQAKFTGISADAYSKNDLGIQSLTWRALYNSTANTEISILKTAA